jgi:hypothetical protein
MISGCEAGVLRAQLAILTDAHGEGG